MLKDTGHVLRQYSIYNTYLSCYRNHSLFMCHFTYNIKRYFKQHELLTVSIVMIGLPNSCYKHIIWIFLYSILTQIYTQNYRYCYNITSTLPTLQWQHKSEDAPVFDSGGCSPHQAQTGNNQQTIITEIMISKDNNKYQR